MDTYIRFDWSVGVQEMIPLVAIVGRPNVGKSTLFNRLIGEKKAIVLDTPGVTRDRNYGEATWRKHRFNVVDTGGFEPKAQEGITAAMRRQGEQHRHSHHQRLLRVELQRRVHPFPAV